MVISPLRHDGLLDLEHRGWQSLCSGTGGSFYGELMTTEAVMVLVNGWVLDRRAVRASLDDSPPWSSYQLSDVRHVPISADSAALVYRARAVRPEMSAPFEALMTSVYTVSEHRARLALYQQTTITH